MTLLSDEGGNTSESPANGTLVLVDGAINIPSQMGTAPLAAMAGAPSESIERSRKASQSPRPARFLNNPTLAASRTLFSPRTSTYTTTTNHDAAFTYDEAGDVLHDVLPDGTGRSFTYDALSMTTGATAPLTNGGGSRTFAYIYTADDERIALVEELSSGGTTTNWTLRGLDNHLLRTWTNNSTTGWSWREDDIWRGAALLANESPTGVRHYGLDHLGSPAILTDAIGHSIGPLTFDAFGNGGATGAGMLEYTGHERDSFNVGSSPGTVILPDYLHARYYDSARGRFLSVDASVDIEKNLLEPSRWNRYSYATNNPIKFLDPNGRDKTIYILQSFAFDSTTFLWGDVERLATNGYEVDPHRFSSESTYYEYLAKADHTDFVFTFSHAAVTGISDASFFSFDSSRHFDNSAVSSSSLAAAVNSDTNRPAGIALIGCNTIKPAQDLANKTGVPVVGSQGLMTFANDKTAIAILTAYISKHGLVDQAAIDQVNKAICPSGKCDYQYQLAVPATQ